MHRLGGYCAGKARPLVENFASFKDKHVMLANKQKKKTLKGIAISISENVSNAVRRKREQLGDLPKNHRSEGTRINIRHETMHLYDTKCDYDEALVQFVQSARQRKKSRLQTFYLWP